MAMSLAMGLSLSSLRNGGWSPARLLTGASQLAYYDPSDLSTLFQDNAGTTPVTADGQSVGRVLDKSGNGNHLIQSTAGSRPLYGFHPATGVRNLLTKTEEFDNAAWTKARANISSSTTITASETNASGTWVGQAFTGQLGANTIFAFVAKNSGWVMLTGLNNSVQTNNVRVWFNTDTGLVGASQNNGSGFTVSASSINDFGANWRLTVSYSADTTAQQCRFFVVDGDASISTTVSRAATFGGVQAELGSTDTAYQKVNTANGVTEAGVPTVYFLKFDGTDDFLVSAANVDPGSVDKAQVFAGVRKLSDAATGTALEHSVSSDSNDGTLFLRGPADSGTNAFTFRSKGTIARNANVVLSSFPAPVTCVVSGVGDISGDTSTLFVNGSQVGQSTGDQGTGNYLSYPLYVGRRAGTSLPFNGNIYSLIVRFSAANLDAAVIDQAERWTAGKTGVTL